MDPVKPLVDRPRISAAEFERMGECLDPCELWDGVVLVHDPAAPYGDAVCLAIGGLLRAHVVPRSLGWVFGSSAGFQVGENPDRVLSPDVAFLRRERLPSLPKHGFYRLTPDLVVEVRSPSQTWAYTLERGGIWIASGAQVVWMVDPEPRTACVFRPMAAPIEVGPDGALSADPAIEGFSITMRDVFEGLD
jgi:Uma2 family endonuclease